MTADQIEKLRQDVESEIKAGATTNEIERWLAAYYAGRKDLIDVIRGYIQAPPAQGRPKKAE